MFYIYESLESATIAQTIIKTIANNKQSIEPEKGVMFRYYASFRDT